MSPGFDLGQDLSVGGALIVSLQDGGTRTYKDVMRTLRIQYEQRR